MSSSSGKGNPDYAHDVTVQADKIMTEEHEIDAAAKGLPKRIKEPFERDLKAKGKELGKEHLPLTTGGGSGAGQSDNAQGK
jgi:hypothetical protein